MSILNNLKSITKDKSLSEISALMSGYQDNLGNGGATRNNSNINNVINAQYF